jgi:predicted enzyme related to lactoylglutathione lyase
VTINGTHALIYAKDAEAARAFFRDVLELPNVSAGEGWLIFRLPPAELGIHPVMPDERSGAHALSLMCDDIKATMAELEQKGVQFTSPIQDQGYGLITTMVVPGGAELALYEPRHPIAYNLGD